MRHPGTFNGNPLSAAAGIATLEIVATGTPCSQANATARMLRQRLNALFTQRNVDWVAYGEFSSFRLLSGYRGSRPQDDTFVPYEGSLDKLDGPRNPKLTHAFRQAMLLHGVDLWGLSGSTMEAHTVADVEQTVTAVASSLDLLREEGLA
jgi:glutamate-1-semialdehyde 2,1-aminomutase